MILAGDALISFLNKKTSGSWALFSRVVEELTGAAKYAYGTAIALSARGFVEFSWLKDRRWTALPTGIVRLPNSSPSDCTRYLLVGLLEADMLAKLQAAELEVETYKEPLTERLSYTRTVAVDVRHSGVLEDDRLIGSDPRFSYVKQHLGAGFDLLHDCPQLGSAIASRDIENLDELNSLAIESFNPKTLAFGDNGLGQSANVTRPEIVRATDEFGSRRYYYVDLAGARRVERELGLPYAARSLPYIFREGDKLLIDKRVPLPSLVERSIFLSGARLGDDRYVSPWSRFRVYCDVDSRMLSRLSLVLMTTLHDAARFGENV